MSARRLRSSGKKSGKSPDTSTPAKILNTPTTQAHRSTTSGQVGITLGPLTQPTTALSDSVVVDGPTPAPQSSQRPPRRSKTEALAKKVWSADAPTSRKRTISVSTVAATQGTRAPKKGKKVVQAAATGDATKVGELLAKPGSLPAASTQFESAAHHESGAVDIEMSSGEDAPLSRTVSKGKRIPPRPKRASTMGLDYRTFVADDGGLGTTASPSDDDGEVSAADSEDPEAALDDEECDGMRSASEDELHSDVEAEELAKTLAAEKPTWTENNKSANIPLNIAVAGNTKTRALKTPARPRKRSAATTNQTYQLAIEDLDNSGSSGSEFEPEECSDDELPSEEYTVDTQDHLDDDVADEDVQGASATGKTMKPKSNKASATRGPKAKQLLEQPVWKDLLLAAIANSYGPSTGLPANFDLSAFAEEVHAHIMHQVVKTPTPAVSDVSIPSHLGFAVSSHPRSNSGHGSASTSSVAPPPGAPDHHGSSYESDNDDHDGHGPQYVHSLTTTAATTVMAAPNTTAAQAQDKPAAEYTIVPPMQPGGTLQLMVQEEAIRTTVRLAIADLDRYLAFENSFPDAITRSRVIADLLATAVQSLGFDGLQGRLKSDHDFTRTLSALPKQRMSTFRGNIKKLADAQVVAFYGLVPGECKEKVEWLFFHLTYIYPFTYTDEKKAITWSAPNKGPIVRHLLHLAFCNGPTSIAAKNPDRFKSSMEIMPQADEKEMPMPMVTLVGAAIHAALSEWRTGVHKPMAFSADAFADAYNEHILLLTGIKNKNMRGYHAMMHRLYREATGIIPPTATAVAPNGSALDQVDFANMDMD